MSIEELSLQPTNNALNLKAMDQNSLMKLRNEIDMQLGLDMRSIDLNKELGLQYMQAKMLYTEVGSDNATPANQKAQILNTISSIIASITKTSAEIHSVERQKKIEAATLACVKELPMEAKTKFFDMLKEFLVQDE